MKKIAVYGSLKKGFWNYDHFLKEANFLGESKIIGGMQMSMGSYPYLFESSEEQKFDTEYVVEIYEVEDKIYERIDGMETGAGYYAKEIDTPYGTATIYYALGRLFNADKAMLEEYTRESVEAYRKQTV